MGKFRKENPHSLPCSFVVDVDDFEARMGMEKQSLFPPRHYYRMWIPRWFLTVIVTLPRRFSNRRGIQVVESRRGIQGRGIVSDSTMVF
ncbi:hypothetical protein TIFTF001_024741 [Ficus carica]|uniref:Uncharacterized protein n=1 Tax=Ficus carica TaxID=3494 RepID=A0AA88AMK1_FICCA|nr:hypothetical protein TIFTF001_024741 [Ficus carica]